MGRKAARRQSRGRTCLLTALQPVPHSAPASPFAPWLVNRYAADVLDVDILNAPHHGSKHASTPAFIGATTPRTVIFSTNENNQYGHPHQDAVNRYAGADHLLRTHTGDIIIQTDGAGCSMFLNGNLEDEVACFGGIAVVPEFSHIMMIGIIAMIPVILLERVRMHL